MTRLRAALRAAARTEEEPKDQSEYRQHQDHLDRVSFWGATLLRPGIKGVGNSRSLADRTIGAALDVQSPRCARQAIVDPEFSVEIGVQSKQDF